MNEDIRKLIDTIESINKLEKPLVENFDFPKPPAGKTSLDIEFTVGEIYANLILIRLFTLSKKLGVRWKIHKEEGKNIKHIAISFLHSDEKNLELIRQAFQKITSGIKSQPLV